MAQISFLHLISQTYFIFHQVETKQVETMRVFENVILICEVFTFYFSFVSFGLVPMEWEFGTNTLLVHVSKHLEVRQKYSGPCRIFESSRCLEVGSNTISSVSFMYISQLNVATREMGAQ